MAHPKKNKGNWTFDNSGRRRKGDHAPWFKAAIKLRRKRNKIAKASRRSNR